MRKGKKLLYKNKQKENELDKETEAEKRKSPTSSVKKSDQQKQIREKTL